VFSDASVKGGMAMDEIILVDPAPAWPDKFQAEAAIVRSILGRDRIAAIEHIGRPMHHGAEISVAVICFACPS
jgi:GrpB-like predicted nucleotidyltransferase (UPF0157 family)